MKLKAKNMLREIKPLLFGCATGIISGVVVSVFLICARVVSTFAEGIFQAADTPLFIICLIALALVCCVTMATLQTLYPPAKGSGIPLAECCARGMLRVKWLKTTGAIIAGSLLSFACGLPVGSEGPSICVGGMVGDGLGRSAKQPSELRRYLVTGGSSAGLAVAFNAPLTGVAFALEETHRRFSPRILIASFSAVVPAVIISRLIFYGFGCGAYFASLGVGADFAVLDFLRQTDYTSVSSLLTVCGAAVVCSIACGLIAVLFNRAVFTLGKFMSKIKFAALRLAPVFVLTLISGLFLAYSIGSGELTLAHISTDTSLWLLFVLLAIRLVMTTVAGGSKVTGGLFLPMIAIGGIFGNISARICTICGMDGAYANNIIMLCISAFFAASVRAPISAIAMAIELTGSFANLLPVTLAVALATAVGGVTRTEPLYERMMEDLRDMNAPNNGTTLEVVGIISSKAFICGKRIRDVLWPYNSLVTELVRDGNELVPDGETVLFAGDRLTVSAERVEPEYFFSQIREFLTVESVNDISAQTPRSNR